MVAAHEVGHALGLDHSNNKSDLMYYATRQYLAGTPILSENDIRAAQVLYGN